ncbi:MAG TPA: MarR family transcriptional regulator [Parasegetibacter sp.]
MSFYTNLGFLAFGSRLRRISETFIADVNSVYKEAGLEFDASWFPIFYILSEKERLSIREISEIAGVSHSAVSQLVTALQYKELIAISPSEEDGRKKEITLTKKGKNLLSQIKPVWNSIEKAMIQLSEEEKHCNKLLEQLGGLETALQKQPLKQRIEQILKKQ